MKAPMCPICKTAHWGLGACPSFAEVPKAELAKKAVEAVTEIKERWKTTRGWKEAHRGAADDPIGARPEV
jgi:hypothetical protein